MASKLFTSLANFFRRRRSSERTADTQLLTHGDTTFAVDEVKRGGMGVVYLCRMLDKKGETRGRVALKTFDEAHFFDAEMTQAVSRESSVWARLTDVPYVFPLMNVLDIDGKSYFMMPIAQPDEHGVVSVRDALARSQQGLPAETCLEIGMCVALALTIASQRIPGVVHGDIKPDNILFLAQTPFLADFGLAGRGVERGPRGTPPYMAPELYDGHQSTHSDIYAFGVMLAEVLTGELPFRRPRNESDWARVHKTATATVDTGMRNEDAELFAALAAVARRCLAKNIVDRPDSFETVFHELSAVGLQHAPAVAMEVVERAAGLKRLADEQAVALAESRINSRLRQNDVEGALELVNSLPDDHLNGGLLLAAGTTRSLAGDDESALVLFDRFLASDAAADAHLRLKCQSERGLSLKRLGRLDEARELYRSLLPDALLAPELVVTIRGNYAATLIELGEFADARDELGWLLQRYPANGQVCAMYATLLEKSGELGSAVHFVGRAINAEPRNGAYHVARARISLRLRRVQDALESIDRAYAVGHRSKEWLTLAMAVNMAVDDRNAVAELFQISEQALPEGTRNEVTRDVVEWMRYLLNKDDSPGAPRTESSDREGASAVAAAAKPTTVGSETSQDERRGEIAAGRRPHLQARLSHADGSFTFDFYLDFEVENYVEAFKAAYLEAKAEFETKMPGMAERQTPYRFTRCDSCRFAVLTARDENESFRCQACDERSAVVTINEDKASRIAALCREAIGRQGDAIGDNRAVAVAFWLAEQQVDAVTERMRAEGFDLAPSDSMIFGFFTVEHAKRNDSERGAPSQIWHRALDPTDVAAGGETPLSLDLILRTLRRRTGPLTSMSTVMGQWELEHLVKDATGRLELFRSLYAERADDYALLRALVSAEIEVGNRSEAQRLASAAEAVAPDDPDVILTVATLELASNRWESAAALAERVLENEPRNLSARMLAMRAYKGAGDEERLGHHARAYAALGGVLRRSDS